MSDPASPDATAASTAWGAPTVHHDHHCGTTVQGGGPVTPSSGTAPADGTRQLFVVPCSRTTLGSPAPARSLYTGSMFRFRLSVIARETTLAAAVGVPARVMILSARHGLLEPRPGSRRTNSR
ncbi:DUF6884 domain-containing protein [Saccharothrix lopnurensis]|uniref:DUF6884 domain-containing protein n=1 Tax=Saccharothrix lopnurensis TaxID=1670621 RepID=A0ABW1PFI5_9PSEU